MMLQPPEMADDSTPGTHLPCPNCCSVWWTALVVLDGDTRELKGYIDRVRCVNCSHELNLEESEV